MVSCTLVTAFYPIRSKFPKDVYIQWAHNFLQLSCPIVLFTTVEMEPLFRQMRGDRPIHIIVATFDDLYMWKLYKREWIAHHLKDPEKDLHTPELYAVWAQKPIFVEQAIHANVFHTEFFYWCDIGAFRVPVRDIVRRTFPTCAFPPNKVLFTSVEDLSPASEQYNLDGLKHTIVGGLWGGCASACLRWRYAYEAMLIRYFGMGIFAGKDQTVMLSAYLENSSLGEIVRPKTRKEPGYDDWFFAQRLLSEEVVAFEKDKSYIIERQKPVVSVYLRGGLGNQLFQIATAFSYAKSQSASLRLLRTKPEEDGRSMYWETVLVRFTAYLTDRLPNNLRVWWESHLPIPAIQGDGVLLQGYYQSSRYFGQEKEDIRRMLNPDLGRVDMLRMKYAYLFENKERVVVVHARRTDYLKAIDYHGPLDHDYYRSAIEIVRGSIVSPIFLLTSDDNMFWLDILPMLQTNPFVMVDDTDVNTFVLLQQFHYFILANSSFSWWSAWLADTNTVIAPRRWFGPTGPKEYEDIYEPSWIRV
jgi:hypothetical protein